MAGKGPRGFCSPDMPSNEAAFISAVQKGWEHLQCTPQRDSMSMQRMFHWIVSLVVEAEVAFTTSDSGAAAPHRGSLMCFHMVLWQYSALFQKSSSRWHMWRQENAERGSDLSWIQNST